MKSVLQIALDFTIKERALKVAREAVAGGVDWIEAGTPLIKSEGLDVVRGLRAEFPDHTIVADMKIMDAGRIEVEAAAKAGADIVDVLGAAADETIEECVETGQNYGAKIVVDLIAVRDPAERAKQIEELGADYIAVHTAIDEQMHGAEPFEIVRRVVEAVSVPVAVAGGIHAGTAASAVEAGASIVIVGGALTKSQDVTAAARQIKTAIETGQRFETVLYKRGGEADLRRIFSQVSTANISDAMHRTPCLPGIRSIVPGAKLLGRAVTCRTYPGDFAKPVLAVDAASEGDVIVIDAGGVPPALWGELATHGAIEKELGGVVIDGAIRDVEDIRRMRFPAFSKHIASNAGEPKGFGEINVPVMIAGTKVFPGDWLVGDEDGVMVVPQKQAVETSNRAMDVLEAENRLRREIEQGSTLGKVAQILRWEKQHQ